MQSSSRLQSVGDGAQDKIPTVFVLAPQRELQSVARGFLIWECLSNSGPERGHDFCEIAEARSADKLLHRPA
jgi:hypothetical protein